MKQKVSQKEWNDKRDAFLCAIMNSAIINSGFIINKDAIEQAIKQANELTSELYEVEEKTSRLTKETLDKFKEYLDTNSEEKILSDLKSFVIPANSIKEGDTISFQATTKTEDTRSFNPKVVEIFNKFLPKEIAALAIEAHKRSCDLNNSYNRNVNNLEDALMACMNWSLNLGNFYKLCENTKDNTITATPEHLREWFPQAYKNEGGENE